MYYLANGAKVTERSVLVKKTGEEPMLFVWPWSARKPGARACG